MTTSQLLAGSDPATPAERPFDGRLVPAAVCCWSATILAIRGGPIAGVTAALVSAALAGGVWWWGRKRAPKPTFALIGALLLGSCFAGSAAVAEYRVSTHPLRSIPSRAVLDAVVTATGEAKPLRAKSFSGQRTWLLTADLEEFRRRGTRTRAGGAVTILATGSEWEKIIPGQQLEFPTRVKPPHYHDLTVATLFPTGSPQLIRGPPWWQQAAQTVRRNLATAAAHSLSPDAAAVLPSLVLGDTSGFSEELHEQFKASGLEHLCVVSGANLAILLAAVLFATRLVGCGPKVTAGCGGITVVVFVILARPDPSVLRAAAMGVITVVAIFTGRQRQALPALCAGVIGLLAIVPELALRPAFALSVLATGALVVVAPHWVEALTARGWPHLGAELVGVSTAAFVVTAPVIVALSGQLNPVGIIANIAAEPVVAPLTVIGFVGAAAASVWSPVAEMILRCAAPPMWWLLQVAQHAARWPEGVIRIPGGALNGLWAALFLAAAVYGMRFAVVRRVCAAAALGVAAVLMPMRCFHPGWPPPGWVVAACDIGQGDGFAVAAGSHSAVVIDTGPDPKAMRRCLDRLGIRAIPLLVLTHPHADHIGGVSGASAGRTIGAIATGPGELNPPPHATSHSRPADFLPTPRTKTDVPGNIRAIDTDTSRFPASTTESVKRKRSEEPDDPEGITEVKSLADKARIPIRELSAGDRLTVGPVFLEVLAPRRAARPATASKTTRNPNNRSLIIMMTTPAGRILFPGDAEGPEQLPLLAHPDQLRADILKVPHHGSHTTRPQFLAAVHPRLALIGVGRHNDFGHPHQQTLHTLTSLGATIARTDRDGDITVTAHHGTLQLHTHPPPDP